MKKWQTSRVVHTLPNTEDEFDAKFGKEFGVKFGVNERKVLLLLASNPSLSAENIAEQIGLSKRGVEKQLKKFRDLGIITRKGSDKTGYWEIVKEQKTSLTSPIVFKPLIIKSMRW